MKQGDPKQSSETREFSDEELAELSTMLVNRIQKNKRRLKSWRKQKQISCYRAYDCDIPELPLSVDDYEGKLVIADKRRYSDDERWLRGVCVELSPQLDVARDDIYFKRRRRQRGKAQYEKAKAPGQRHIVQEGGLRFLVDFEGYLDTGLFLDHRNTRQEFAGKCEGKRFLNLFCYTGAFSVYGAGGGAASSVSVDMSSRYVSWAKDNLVENNLARRGHELVQANVMEYLAKNKNKREFDLAIVDPPTFSNSKRMEGHFDVQRDHVALISSVVGRMNPGGEIYFSTNFRKFNMEVDGTTHARISMVEEISQRTLSPDFRDGKIHRCFLIQIEDPHSYIG